MVQPGQEESQINQKGVVNVARRVLNISGASKSGKTIVGNMKMPKITKSTIPTTPTIPTTMNASLANAKTNIATTLSNAKSQVKSTTTGIKDKLATMKSKTKLK